MDPAYKLCLAVVLVSRRQSEASMCVPSQAKMLQLETIVHERGMLPPSVHIVKAYELCFPFLLGPVWQLLIFINAKVSQLKKDKNSQGFGKSDD